MIARSAIPIEDDDTVGSLFEKLAIVGRDLLLDTLPAYVAGECQPIPQNEEDVSYSPNISPEEEQIDWGKTNRHIFNHIRGMNPWPVAYTLWKGERFKIYAAKPTEGEGKPGQVLEKSKNRFVVATGQGALCLELVQPSGKPRMPITDFLNGMGRQIEVGDSFG